MIGALCEAFIGFSKVSKKAYVCIHITFKYLYLSNIW